MNEYVSVADAQYKILDAFSPTNSETITIEAAHHRVLAEDIFSSMDLPAFANSSMDGYAVRAQDVINANPQNPIQLQVVADIPAGYSGDATLTTGQAARIMTGAPIPAGSNAVVPVEFTDLDRRDQTGLLNKQVMVYKPVENGDFIRPAGQDIKSGELVLTSKSYLRAQDVALLAMLGISDIRVFRQPRVAIFSSGDELLPVNASLTPGKIHDSNTYMIVSLVEDYGGRAINLGIAEDSFESVQDIFERGLAEKVDLIISSAGVSVGVYDYVRSVLEKNGELGFWRVNMRPGKPLTFGQYRNTPFIGLPGNPVSAFVGFEVFIRPVLLKLGGIEDWRRPMVRVKIEDPIESDGRESFLRAVVREREGTWLGRLTGHQGSGNLHSLVQANALFLIPSGVKSLPIGSEVNAWLFNNC